MAVVCSRNDLTVDAGSLTTVDLFRWATHLNASADMLEHVDLAFPALDVATLLQI